jgi:hypothetical protein
MSLVTFNSMTQFYRFRWAQTSKEILIKVVSHYDYESLFTGNDLLPKPLKTRVAEGSKLFDIVHLENPCNFSISEKAYNLLIENKATGWKPYDLTIEGISEKYYGFQVTGKCGPLARPPQAGFVQGYSFDLETWDGSDFFYPEGTTSLFCTERIRDVLISNNVTNLKFDRSDLVEWYSV